jgi:hypothetical protein
MQALGDPYLAFRFLEINVTHRSYECEILYGDGNQMFLEIFLIHSHVCQNVRSGVINYLSAPQFLLRILQNFRAGKEVLKTHFRPFFCFKHIKI